MKNCPNCGYKLFIQDGKCRTCRQKVSNVRRPEPDIVQCPRPDCKSVKVRFCYSANAIICMDCGEKWRPNV